jgi:2-keto-4-pentenoate hydratase/2-oxohepta-3-ene-1,7-dioic acid hydratase in catechol pathway
MEDKRMRLATYSTGGSAPRAGVLAGDRIHDIQAGLPQAPGGMPEILASLDALRPALQALAADVSGGLALAAVTLHAPILRPGKILALGLNYRDHAAEAAMALPERQLWFAKMPSATNGPYAPIQLPRVSDKLDHEAELVIVIGRRARHVSRAQAPTVIAGYCAGNDVSVRDWQFHTTQFVVGKSFDTHAPFGPWIVTADEIADVQNLGIRCKVNGVMRQDSNTREMVFDCYSMIEYLSQAMTLEPGDVIFTGTPAGVGAVCKPPRYLKAGDVVRVEIDGIGAIENRVEPEAQ